MVTWNVEEMKLLNDKEFVNKLKKMSNEDKIKFIDQFQNGKMTEAVRLIHLYRTDSQNGVLKFDNNYGSKQVKTVSLKAWLIKNDKMNIFDKTYCYGQSDFLKNYIQRILDIEELVDTRLDMEINGLINRERKYFLDNDEQNILEKKLEKFINQYGIMGFHCLTGTKGLRFGNFNNNRKFTIEEMKMLISKYEELEEFKGKLAKDIVRTLEL